MRARLQTQARVGELSRAQGCPVLACLLSSAPLHLTAACKALQVVPRLSEQCLAEGCSLMPGVSCCLRNPDQGLLHMPAEQGSALHQQHTTPHSVCACQSSLCRWLLLLDAFDACSTRACPLLHPPLMAQLHQS